MSTTSARRAAGARAAGFTLLEVLAAIAVLALVYTALARAAMQGLAHEGDATRRIQASLLADQKLAEIEAGLAANVAPPLGQSETEAEDFTVALDVRPFDLGAFALAASETVSAKRGAPAAGEGPAPGTPSLQLLMAPPGAPSPLLEIDVAVRWMEGADEQQVTRTTFAADPATVAAALGGLTPSGEGPGGPGAGKAKREAAAPAPDGGEGGGSDDQ